MPSPHSVFAPTAAASSTSVFPGPSAAATASPLPIAVPKSALNPSSQQRHYHSNSQSNSVSAGQNHIASTLVYPSHSFSAASLPRTSSLLPPPHLDNRQRSNSNAGYPPPVFRNLFNGHPTLVLAEPVTEQDPGSSPLPPSQHSRPSSVGGLNEGFRNLNRWSASSTSSRGSNPTHQRTSSFGRRMSVDTVAVQALPDASPPAYHSPRKLQKLRPSTAGGSPRPVTAASRVRQRSPAPVPPLASLPPIVALPSLALPSLEQEVRGGSPSLAGRTLPQRPAYLRQPSTDDIDYFGDDTGIRQGDATRVERTDGKGVNAADKAAMPYDWSGDNARPRGHSRNRSQNAKGSADSSTSRDKSGKLPSQKAMLSKALQKANTAVQLDNAGNVEGARQSYAEACDLLQQVLLRTSGEEDKKKLEAIRRTYTTRIDELDHQAPTQNKDTRPLPKRPESSLQAELSDSQTNDEDSDEEPIIGMATTTRVLHEEDAEPRTVPSYSIPISTTARVQPMFTPGPPDIPRYTSSSLLSDQYTLQSSFSKSPRKDSNINGLTLQMPAERKYIPPPLSPRRPSSPRKQIVTEDPPEAPVRNDSILPDRPISDTIAVRGHTRGSSHESISWLDPIDESGGSRASSVHSRSSSAGVRRKHIRAPSGDTEAEFDAALDDAIEAAYDEGYEPMDPVEANGFAEDGEAVVANALRRVEIAKERVRESEREAMALASERERRLRETLEQQEREEQDDFGEPSDFYDGNDSDEEERIMEEMSHGYTIEDFSMGSLQSKRAIPRASDSSEMTSRTWHSSMASNPPTATTVMTNLSTVSENTILPVLSKGSTNMMPPPPSQSLPQLPPQLPPQQPRILAEQSPTKDSVRNRRLSGQNPKELKIETSKIVPITVSPATAGVTAGPNLPPVPVPSAQPKTAGFIAQQRQALSTSLSRGQPSRQVPSPAAGVSPSEPPFSTPPLPPAEPEARSGSPAISRPGLRKNFSSSSLRSVKSRNLSVSAIDDTSDWSPGTPSTNQFGANARLPAMPSLPTPIATAFKERMGARAGTGGLHLFDNEIHSPTSPGTPNALLLDGPASLEPCPRDHLLRPFWLMRCLYQTLAHPRGGYLSNKLFVPRDAWCIKGVKLKSVDDKIAQCDLLTAGLMKLARVDNCDADDLLDEMQSFEGLLESVESILIRKLGSEVGPQSASVLFKDASNGPDVDNGSNVPRSASVSGKPSSFSWRRLRSKNSSAGLGNAYADRGRKESITDDSKDGLTIPSLPMTSHPTSKPTKRDVASVQFSGPNANYMAALARLFDAAQTVDQIARQVEDPGLRHTDKTQVGLELSTRHAAGFFGFFICRFVLADLTMLLDKYVKRSSEWVLV